MLKGLKCQGALSFQSMRLRTLKMLKRGSTLNGGSMPRVHKYISTLMERLQGLSMVNSSLLN
jgi:hypothetical protein